MLRDQAEGVFEARRALKVKNGFPQVGVCVADHGSQAGQACRGGFTLAVERELCCGFYLHTGIAQHLPQAVMQLARHALPLALDCVHPLVLEHLRLRPAHFRHVGQHEQVAQEQAAEIGERREHRRVMPGLGASAQRDLGQVCALPG